MEHKGLGLEPLSESRLVTSGSILSQLLKAEKTKRICQDCGREFEAYWSNYCNECVTKRREDKELAERQATEQRERLDIQNMVTQSGIPERWQGVRFDNSDSNIHADLFGKAREYADIFTLHSPSILFYASEEEESIGTGKTHLAVCIANHILHEKGIGVLFLKAKDLLMNLRGLYAPDAPMTESGYLSQVLSVPLLVLDDVGRDRPTDWTDNIYWTVFDRRWESNLPMIVTTNKSPILNTGDSLENRIGYAALSRLLSMCSGLVFEIGGPDLR